MEAIYCYKMTSCCYLPMPRFHRRIAVLLCGEFSEESMIFECAIKWRVANIQVFGHVQ